MIKRLFIVLSIITLSCLASEVDESSLKAVTTTTTSTQSQTKQLNAFTDPQSLLNKCAHYITNNYMHPKCGRLNWRPEKLSPELIALLRRKNWKNAQLTASIQTPPESVLALQCFSETGDNIHFMEGINSGVLFRSLNTNTQQSSQTILTNCSPDYRFNRDHSGIYLNNIPRAIYNIFANKVCIISLNNWDNLKEISFSLRGDLYVLEYNDGTIRVVDAHTNATVKELKTHDERITFLHISPDGNRLCTRSDYYKIKVWDIPTGVCLREFTSDNFELIYSISLNKSGSKLLVNATHIYVINIDSGEFTRINCANFNSCICFNTDDTASVYSGNNFEIYDTMSGEIVSRKRLNYLQHPESIKCNSSGDKLCVNSFETIEVYKNPYDSNEFAIDMTNPAIAYGEQFNPGDINFEQLLP